MLWNRAAVSRAFILVAIAAIALGYFVLVNRTWRLGRRAVEIGPPPPVLAVVDLNAPCSATVKNVTGRDVKITGGGAVCSEDGCKRFLNDFPIILHPGETTTVTMEVSVHQEGRFSLDVPIYVEESSGLAIEYIKVRGTATPGSESVPGALNARLDGDLAA